MSLSCHGYAGTRLPSWIGCAGSGIEAEMTVLVKNRKLEINIKLAVLLLADGLIILFGMKVLEFICTNNILRGQF
jgi:hypothetical protein